MTRMRTPWFRRKIELFQSIQSQIASVYPNLHFVIEARTVYIRGSYPICYGRKIIDRFLIEIKLPPSYPKGIPIVREIGGRIPQVPDRHINRKGEACLAIPFQFLDLYPVGAAILDFLNGPVNSFFVSQSVFEATGKWPFGEWSHGKKGIDEFWEGVLGISNQATINRFVELIHRKVIKGHWKCPCGSGKRLRDCHMREAIKMHSYYHYANDQFAWQNKS